MERDLIINVEAEDVEIALLEDKRLTELHKDKKTKSLSVGDVYFGTVRKLIPGLNAAFVDIGEEKDAFLHYTDLGPYILTQSKYINLTKSGRNKKSDLKNIKYEAETVKTGHISDVLEPNQQVLVQIEKEPISTKGARVSCEITIPGRFMVLYPFYNHISISKKIRGRDERKRLQRLLESIKPQNFGLIIRTAANNKNTAELNEDLTALVKKWDAIHAAIIGMKELKKPPRYMRVLAEDGKTKSILRDILNDSFNKIVINDEVLFNEVRDYTDQIAPELSKIVKLYKSDIPIFDNFGVRKQVKSSFGAVANMKSSSYLVIEKTEALNVIDVNSGHKVDSSKNLETNAFNVNLEAAKEVARQLRLRDMGGITIVDFIDMRDPANKKKIFETVQTLMKGDRAKHTILPLTKFNLMQITRQRVRPETEIKTAEECPMCKGKGTVDSSILVVDEINRELDHQLNDENKGKHDFIKLYAHPFLAAYLKERKGFFKSQQIDWFWKYKKWIKVIPNNDFYTTQFKIFNQKGEL